MKVVAFNGSPHSNGNTVRAIEKVFDELRPAGIECECIHIAEQPLKGCTACYACMSNSGKCVQKDDLNEWFLKAAEADAIIIGSPTYFANVSAETKALIDRIGLLAKASSKLKRKPLAAVIVARRGGAVPAYDAINHMAQINQMITIGSTYWNFALGMSPGDIVDDEEGMANFANLGENLLWLLQKLNK